jgi:putative transposase
LAAWQTASLDAMDLVGLLIDGVHIGEPCLIVALGIAADGQKHALGVWDGSTENARVCQDLLANLQSRGLRTDRSVLVILDPKHPRGSQRSRSSMGARPPAARVSGRRDEDRSAPAPRSRARRLETAYPSAAESVREGLDETLTVVALTLSPRLRRSLATTNAAESLRAR